MRRIAAILCSAAILASYPGIAALGQEPEIAIPVGAGVSGSSLFGQEEDGQGRMYRRRGTRGPQEMCRRREMPRQRLRTRVRQLSR